MLRSGLLEEKLATTALPSYYGGGHSAETRDAQSRGCRSQHQEGGWGAGWEPRPHSPHLSENTGSQGGGGACDIYIWKPKHVHTVFIMQK